MCSFLPVQEISFKINFLFTFKYMYYNRRIVYKCKTSSINIFCYSY
jgi:hypothetical protein